MIIKMEKVDGDKNMGVGDRSTRSDVNLNISPDIAGNEIIIPEFVSDEMVDNIRHNRDHRDHNRFISGDDFGPVTYIIDRPDKIAVWATCHVGKG